MYFLFNTPIVYFDQHLVFAHSKHWLKYAFSMFFVLSSTEFLNKKIQLRSKIENIFLIG